MAAVISGALPALVTPLRSAHELDLAGFAALVEQTMEEGASGVLVAGSTGEGPLLEPDHRVRLVRAAVAASGGGPVLACASGASVEEVCRDVERVATAGAALVLVLAPNYLPLEPEELAEAHLRIADRAPVPTLVYHIPQFTGSALTPETIAGLAAHEGIVGMKDSSPDADRRAAFVSAAGTAFAVMTGHAATLAQALRSGASGSITAIANLRQRSVVALHDAVEAGDPSRSEQLQRSLTATVSGLASVPGSMPAAVKAALQLRGVIAERWCRPPLRSVPAGDLDRVRTALLS